MATEAGHGESPFHPMEQFEIKPLAQLDLGGYDVSFTNSALWMLITAVVVTGFLLIATSRRALVPGRLQSMAEIFYETIANMVRDNVGQRGRSLFPWSATLFMFRLLGRVRGLRRQAVTFASHIIVTFTMAIIIFLTVTVIGFAIHGLHFLRFFFPHGAPGWTAVILIPIELISYLSRPISLSVRLFANMTVGHVLLKIIAGFVILMGIAGVVPLIFLVGITALEILVAVLQAYVFTILTCIYLHDAIHMH